MNIKDVKLIIFDEIDSILTHIGGAQRGIDPFIKLLKTENTKIFMDAFMNSTTIDIIQNICDARY